jgi:NDP-sugar pyrophosphorylase family protein
MKAMIFAAGLGSRLKPLTDTMPKALVPIAGRPMLEHVILKLKAAGFTEIVINIHHFGEQILDFLKANENFGLIIHISDERDLLLDTGGGIKKARSFFENSDEPYAAEIVASVFGRLKNGKKIETTTDLRNAVEAALVRLPKAEREEAVKKSCARTFQALRIDVNSEFEVLYSFLEKLDGILKPGGRVAILTFHSGEDRLVKKAFKELKKAGVYAEISADVIRPSAEECRLNPRARSTKMRWAVKAE